MAVAVVWKVLLVALVVVVVVAVARAMWERAP